MADTTHDQTYIAILGAGVLQASHNARILAEHGDTQLGRPWSAHPGLRVWDGNLTRLGHHDPAAFVAEVNALLPSHMYVDHAHHWHAHLNDGQWVRCPADADGAVPLTIAITQTRDQEDQS
ncbi:hypothetical protein OG298_45305 (plasmid) [Streptomyces sp. NBC_01005]|uniref:hypothetical protein n=1 Tax=Streptomyces sp. NBC_01005 TaxID=2903715 RepID=UPI002F911CC9|nr:hypothetical protein OG298_45305 [Streptomyces sp. NBC_01005]